MGGSMSGNSRTGSRDRLTTPKRMMARLIIQVRTGRRMLISERIMGKLSRCERAKVGSAGSFVEQPGAGAIRHIDQLADNVIAFPVQIPRGNSFHVFALYRVFEPHL